MNKNYPHLGFLLQSRREGISRCYQRDYSNESNISVCNSVHLHVCDEKICLTYTSKIKNNTFTLA